MADKSSAVNLRQEGYLNFFAKKLIETVDRFFRLGSVNSLYCDPKNHVYSRKKNGYVIAAFRRAGTFP